MKSRSESSSQSRFYFFLERKQHNNITSMMTTKFLISSWEAAIHTLGLSRKKMDVKLMMMMMMMMMSCNVPSYNLLQ